MEEINTRNRIVNTAVAMIRQKGYRNVSVTDICGKLGITRSAFYYYFKTKDEIFDYFLLEPELQITKELISNFKNTAYLDQLKSIIRIFLDYIAGLDTEILRIVLKRHADGGVSMITPLKAPQKETYLALVKQAQQAGELSTRVSAEEIVKTIIYAINGVSLLWVHEKGSFCYQTECEKVLQVIFDGLS